MLFALCPDTCGKVFSGLPQARGCVRHAADIGGCLCLGVIAGSRQCAPRLSLFFSASRLLAESAVFSLQNDARRAGVAKSLVPRADSRSGRMLSSSHSSLILRAHFFGDFWRVYTRDRHGTGASTRCGWAQTQSKIGGKALHKTRPRRDRSSLGSLLGSACVLIAHARGAQRRVAAALLCASGGLVVATLLATRRYGCVRR